MFVSDGWGVVLSRAAAAAVMVIYYLLPTYSFIHSFIMVVK